MKYIHRVWANDETSSDCKQSQQTSVDHVENTCERKACGNFVCGAIIRGTEHAVKGERDLIKALVC